MKKMRLIVVGLALATALVACTDSDETSTCDSLQGLANSVNDLVNIDVVAEGTDGLDEALQTLEKSWQAVESDSADQFGSEVQALSDSVDNTAETVASFGDAESLSSGAAEISAAFDGIEAAWVSLKTAAATELADCDLSTSR
jgi:hypothetical protein